MTPEDPIQSENDSLLLRHMPSLDSIRGLAVLLVISFHLLSRFDWSLVVGSHWDPLVSQTIGCGRYGVNVFFVLSGFLITGILFKAREKPDFYKNFYKRRVLRILPLYLLVLIVLKLSHVTDFRFTLAAVLFLANVSRIFGAPLNEYGSLWSLAVEEHFYLIWPTLIRKCRAQTLTRILLATLIAEPLLRIVAIHLSARIDIHYKTPFVLDYLAYGAMLSLLVHTNRINLRNASLLGTALLSLSACLIFPLVWLTAYHQGPTLDALSELPFTWAACGLVLLGLKRDHKRFVLTGKTVSIGVLPFFGYISYGLYLINVFVFNKVLGLLYQSILPSGMDHLFPFFVSIFAAAAVAIGIAYISRRYFEQPFLDLKYARGSARVANKKTLSTS